jgi:hypothetical protein
MMPCNSGSDMLAAVSQLAKSGVTDEVRQDDQEEIPDVD